MTAHTPNRLNNFILWDLAGTLLMSDPTTRRMAPFPGWELILPDLARQNRMIVTTGEESESARYLLAKYALTPYFEEVFGDLIAPAGKPHGKILHSLGGDTRQSLVIGDRLRGDVPADSEELLMVLVDEEAMADDPAQLPRVLRALCDGADSVPVAFRGFCERAEPDPESIGPRDGGLVTAAWRSPELSGARLWIFEPDWLYGRRMIVAL